MYNSRSEIPFTHKMDNNLLYSLQSATLVITNLSQSTDCKLHVICDYIADYLLLNCHLLVIKSPPPAYTSSRTLQTLQNTRHWIRRLYRILTNTMQTQLETETGFNQIGSKTMALGILRPIETKNNAYFTSL